MSSEGTMRDMTPLLPGRPAILSPGCSLRFTATKTLTIFITPGGSSSPRCSFSTLLSKRACSAATPSSIRSAGLQLALHRDKDLDHLHHAGRQLVAALQLFDLAFETRLQRRHAFVHQICRAAAGASPRQRP